MKKITSLLLFALLIFSSCEKQNAQNYNDLIAGARAFYAAGEYKDSGKTYSKAFDSNEEIDTLAHHYEAARSWALAGEKDPAFEQLFEISNEGKYKDLGFYLKTKI